MLFGENAADADGACQTVDSGLHEPAGVLRGEHRCHRPGQDGVVGGEGAVVQEELKNLPLALLTGGRSRRKATFRDFVDGQSIHGGFTGENTGFARLGSVIEEAPHIG